MTGFNGFPTKSGAGGGGSGGVTSAEITGWPPLPTPQVPPNQPELGTWLSSVSNSGYHPVAEGGAIYTTSSAAANLYGYNAAGTQLFNIAAATVFGASWAYPLGCSPVLYYDVGNDLLYFWGYLSSGGLQFRTATVDSAGTTNVLGTAGNAGPSVTGPGNGSVVAIDQTTSRFKYRIDNYIYDVSYLDASDAPTNTARLDYATQYRYITADETIDVVTVSGNTTNGVASFQIARGGVQMTVTGPPVATMPDMQPSVWSGNPDYLCNVLLGIQTSNGPAFYLRADIDAWLTAVADALGMPT